MGKSGRRVTALLLSLSAAALAGACGSSDGDNSVFDASTPSEAGVDGTPGDDAAFGDTGPHFDGALFGDTNTGPSDAPQVFDVEPSALQTISVTIGQTMPTVVYDATLNGAPINAGWTIDRGDLGSIGAGPSSQATFTPTGTTGGIVNVIAGLNGQTVNRQVLIKLTATQNGANASAPGESAQLPTTTAQLAGGGGVGGVGGEGLGGAVTDSATLTALQTPANTPASVGLSMLYPYDQTVFPRGLLAPLLQWNWSTGDADAIQLQLTTSSGSFSWTGTFGRPAILAMTGGKFIRMPIPQDIWTIATNTAGGPTSNNMPDKLTVSLTIAKAGQGYGPISETWSIAPAELAGTVYYQSYGTQLVKNSTDQAYNNGGEYGAAVLSINEGATGPSVVAGTASPIGPGTGCRVCHTVSSDGSTLIAQHGDNYAATSSYALGNGNAETSLTGFDNTFGWAGLSKDGKLALTNAADLAASAPATQLYAFPPTSTTPIAVTGIPSNLQGGAPTFSSDTKHVSFEFIGGTIGTTTGNGTQLVSMDFDETTNTFSNLKVLATMTGGKRAGFPSFFPTNDAVAFHYQIVNSNHRYNTWHGAEAQIWWSDLATGTASSLFALNGLDSTGMTSYLPTIGTNHGNDTVLNYEPTVNPVASGGYIWIVFTSRRLYGNVATTDPWQSDPRGYDATQVANATTKKLWVAAIDLNAPAGTDPSHPAFYLPAQELLAGNARAFWVLDPCRPDGQSCMSGDQCCNGYCEPGTGDAGLVCTNTPPNAQCSQPQEHCTTAADCCQTTNACVNGFCAVSTPH
jgi:hypothetical protein